MSDDKKAHPTFEAQGFRVKDAKLLSVRRGGDIGKGSDPCLLDRSHSRLC